MPKRDGVEISRDLGTLPLRRKSNKTACTILQIAVGKYASFRGTTNESLGYELTCAMGAVKTSKKQAKTERHKIVRKR